MSRPTRNRGDADHQKQAPDRIGTADNCVGVAGDRAQIVQVWLILRFRSSCPSPGAGALVYDRGPGFAGRRYGSAGESWLRRRARAVLAAVSALRGGMRGAHGSGRLMPRGPGCRWLSSAAVTAAASGGQRPRQRPARRFQSRADTRTYAQCRLAPQPTFTRSRSDQCQPSERSAADLISSSVARRPASAVRRRKPAGRLSSASSYPAQIWLTEVFIPE